MSKSASPTEHPMLAQWSRIYKIMEKLSGPQALGSLWALREYVDRANLVFGRLDSEWKEFLEELMRKEPTIETALAISCDVHYLTIVLDKIEPTLIVLSQNFKKGGKQFRVARKSLARWAKPYADIRDQLEHVDERIRSGLPQGGTVKDGTYTFARRTVRIDAVARSQLNEFMEGLLKALERTLENGTPASPGYS